MAKKSSRPAGSTADASAGRPDIELAGSVRKSAQQIWLAGMGAFAKAQAEGGKVFEALVKEGVRLQRKTQTAAQERLGEVSGRVSQVAAEVSSTAGASWDRLENIFEERTAKALAKLGVPTAREVAALQRRVDELGAIVDQLARAGAGAGPAPETASRKAPAKKAASRRAAARKASATAPSAA